MKTRKEILERINLVAGEPGVPIEDTESGYIAALYWVLGNVS